MYLELAEALDCPECRSAVGLVAFVEEAEGRRVLRGWLGCPLCEVEYPIVEGAIRFGGEGSAAPPGDDAASDEENLAKIRGHFETNGTPPRWDEVSTDVSRLQREKRGPQCGHGHARLLLK